jgi:hypothetical protein
MPHEKYWVTLTEAEKNLLYGSIDLGKAFHRQQVKGRASAYKLP